MKPYLFLRACRWAALLHLSLAACLAAPAATITWTNAASGNWNTAANWNPNQVPGASDTAVITNSGVTVTLDISPTVGGIILGANANCGSATTLAMNSQALTLNGLLAVGACGQFTLNSGTLTGTNNATLSGVINWTGGNGYYAHLAGTWTLATNGTLNIISVTPGLDYHDLPGGTFINNGTVMWTGGQVRGGPGTVIQNNGTWIAQVTNDINSAFGGTPVFNNSGTFDVQVGTATMNISGTSTGTFHVAGGATCNFDYSYNFNSGTAFTGAGTNRLNSGSLTYTVDGSISSQNLEFAGSTLRGTNNATLSGVIAWGGGYQAILAGTLTVATNGTLNITAETYHDFPGGGTLVNNGTVVWTGGPVRGGPGTLIQNNGLWIAQVTNEINGAFGGPSNVFNNSGLFDVQSGTATIQIPGASTGTFHVAAGATCNFISPSDYSFGNGTAFTGAGTNRLSSGFVFTLDGTIYVQNVEFTGGAIAGTHVLSGSNGFAGSFTWIGGNMSTPGSTTIASNATLSIVSGNLHDLPSHTLTNNGTVVFAGGDLRGGTSGGQGSFIQNSGLWLNQVDGSISGVYGGPASFNNSGSFQKTAGSGVTTVSCDFTNSGMVSAQTGTLNFSASFTNAAGTIAVSGGSAVQFAQPLMLSSGLLTGSGTIQAPSITSGATVDPGATNAVLTFSGSYTQLYGGSIKFDLGGTSPGVNQSQVRVTGAAQIDGLIGLRFSPGYSPAVGSSNLVLTADPLKGTYHCYDHFMLLGQNERMLAAYSPTNVTLTAVAAPDPTGPTLGFSAHDQMLVCWPAEFTNFGLYFNTNLALSSWTAIPGATNRYLDSFSSAPQKFFRLIKPVP